MQPLFNHGSNLKPVDYQCMGENPYYPHVFKSDVLYEKKNSGNALKAVPSVTRSKFGEVIADMVAMALKCPSGAEGL